MDATPDTRPVPPRVALCCGETGLHTAIAALLRRDGCEVADCDCADGRLDDLRASSPDVIVIETHARDSAGLELCQSIRSAPDLSHARLLVLQDSGRPIDRRRAEALGAHAVLAMPFAMDSLRAEVVRLLGPV